MNTIKFILGVLITTTLFSCGGDKKKPIYVEAENTTEETDELSYAQSGDEIIVPFRNANGVKYVQVKVNGVGFEMIFDTGCSGALISVAEANYLYQKGKLTQRHTWNGSITNCRRKCCGKHGGKLKGSYHQ